jgi:hypothetical protein
MQGTIEEHDVQTDEYDVHVGEFLNSNSSAITDLIQEAVIKHT